MTWVDRYGAKMIGDLFEVVPGQSAFGCVARLARLNHFSHADLFRFLGLRLRRSDDLHRLLAQSTRRQGALAHALGVPIAEEWKPECWHPFQGDWPDIGTHAFRYCRACVRVGFHSHLHQLPWIAACPWHGVRLGVGCPKCSGAIAVSGDAGRPFLTCGCGFDLMEERAAARLTKAAPGQAEFLSKYLNWARNSRKEQVLLGDPDVPFSDKIARALIRIPTSVIGSNKFAAVVGAEGGHTRTYRVQPDSRSIARPTDASRMKALAADCPRMLELPAFLIEGVRAATRELAHKLPPGSLTEREQLLFLGTPNADLSGFTQADRPTSSTVCCLPPMAVGPRRFLDLSSIHPVVLRIAGSLEPSSNPAAASCEVEIRRRVQRDLVCRGYAEGMRAVLSRYALDLHALARDRPHLTAGWVLLRNRAPFGALVVFTRVDSRSDAADALLAAQRRD